MCLFKKNKTAPTKNWLPPQLRAYSFHKIFFFHLFFDTNGHIWIEDDYGLNLVNLILKFTFHSFHFQFVIFIIIPKPTQLWCPKNENLAQRQQKQKSQSSCLKKNTLMENKMQKYDYSAVPSTPNSISSSCPLI